MAKVPESVNWLLDFFNIKSIAGEYNPRKLIFAKNPNRTPTKPPENPETGYVTDHKGYVYVPSFNNEPECIGKEKFFPTSNDFKEYFESIKIRNASIVKDKDMYQKIKWLWDDLSMAFARIVTANQPIDTERLLSKGVVISIKEQQEIGQSVIESHCRSYLDNYDLETQLRITRGDWLPDIKGIPDVIYIKLLTWSNFKELHALLRQCKCCGAFWIELKQKGRPRDFCINKRCGNIFSPASRTKEKKTKKNNRKTKRESAEAKIIKYTTENKLEMIYDDKAGLYVHRYVSKERAKGFLDEVKQKSPRNARSLREFIRTEGKDW